MSPKECAAHRRAICLEVKIVLNVVLDPIRPDEVCGFMEGSATSGRAMNGVIAGFLGQGPISAFEFQPRLNTSEASRTMDWNNIDFGDRCVMYPREDGLPAQPDECWLRARWRCLPGPGAVPVAGCQRSGRGAAFRDHATRALACSWVRLE
ncbi:hypothetical protein [Paracoccus sp. PAR01]|uniref:hypothetical protein n=1 Tax=Paracoccus sp. PAR01 TaxID=2769282 RepID=UPI00177CE742|nr:hypothetical protein [Paracoccus sp. PAR01]MBD9528249.1 hypothetical protein [Paracoccus sp. PAR01]